MEPRVDEKKSRFEIRKLESRIAPSACFGLTNALEQASPHVDPAQVEFVVDIVVEHNPQAADC